MIDGFHKTSLARVFQEADWQERALCIGRPIWWFYPEHNSDNRSGGLLPAERRAKALCARCPVRKECLQMGMTDEHGIWGGATPAERVRAKRAYPAEDRADQILADMDDQADRLGLVTREDVA